MEPTQHTQTAEPPPDPTSDTTKALTAIADRLTRVRPHAAMTEDTRLARACAESTERHGFSPEAEALERQLLAVMPRVGAPITRGEYALRLRKIPAGAR
ncbi:hypothetical protein [Streptomyces sp. NPDC023838]|uniref:hypothetical protein n=1 Tax=Streptomyces sp. NPDC023838 TaxID=3154325 RepID=UPI0033FC5979